ncbi:uncharacterized protein LOC125312801 [Rhodamnia argentea]|uniref:Uncharacterized protein LOC125312801 n=1 Tax=Rhodamnia argentea TaxID=178133 RepID=A0ABM3GVG8_9MYRT|nr:uncharacterized protein LOC125312801 [Rhodamnia argentea]
MVASQNALILSGYASYCSKYMHSLLHVLLARRNCPSSEACLPGQAPSPEQQRRKAERIRRNKKRRPLHNHYANGGGFWDSGMEGFESEEVGKSEVWEGVGSTTIDGIDWH